ncbi:MAG: preprotein translocase subunit SecA, partial [Bacteroidota bacterium]
MGALNSILKKIVGDKRQKDLELVQPLLKSCISEFEKISQSDANAVRTLSAQLQAKIKEHTADLENHAQNIRQQAEALPNESLDEKESLYAEEDKIKKAIDQALEEVLLEILPTAFAIIKRTAQLFAENPEIRVIASNLDKQLAVHSSKNYIRIEGDSAIWKNTWSAAGNNFTWDMVHYDVQLIGGIALHQGKVAEMATGEGKTLVATLPVFLNGLAKKGVHVVTVNDYLARRDSEWMGPIYEFHGLTVDCIDKHQPNSDARRNAYSADITFGTNNEFGFDYLRDNMAVEAAHLVQRKHHFAIIDEVDSVLIDEARTPLIISGPTPKGDQQEFDALKPKVQILVNAQKAAVNDFLTLAKKKLQPDSGLPSKDDIQEGGMALLRAHRGLPRTKALIKFLSEEGIKSQLLKTEGQYLQDNQREMPKVDAELFFVIDEKNNQIELTDKGIAIMAKNMEDDTFFLLPDLATEMGKIEHSNSSEDEKARMLENLQREYAVKSERIHTISQLLKAYALFEKDKEYVVMENKVKIVDEQTGRIMEGRRFSDGLHQAIEAKENVKVEAATQTYATITLQNYFRMYHKLAGMTGTAETEAGELWDIYKLDVMIMPTQRDIKRKD